MIKTKTPKMVSASHSDTEHVPHLRPSVADLTQVPHARAPAHRARHHAARGRAARERRDGVFVRDGQRDRGRRGGARVPQLDSGRVAASRKHERRVLQRVTRLRGAVRRTHCKVGVLLLTGDNGCLRSSSVKLRGIWHGKAHK